MAFKILICTWYSSNNHIVKFAIIICSCKARDSCSMGVIFNIKLKIECAFIILLKANYVFQLFQVNVFQVVTIMCGLFYSKNGKIVKYVTLIVQPTILVS